MISQDDKEQQDAREAEDRKKGIENRQRHKRHGHATIQQINHSMTQPLNHSTIQRHNDAEAQEHKHQNLFSFSPLCLSLPFCHKPFFRFLSSLFSIRSFLTFRHPPSAIRAILPFRFLSSLFSLRFFLTFVSLCLCALVSFASSALANNLIISNVSLEDRWPGYNGVTVEFDITWENAWRTATNHDAAWVFVKADGGEFCAESESAEEITFDAASGTTDEDGTTMSWSHTVGSEDNRLLIVGVSVEDDTSVSSITYGSASLTYLVSTDNSGAAGVELWYLKNPDPGTDTILVTLSADRQKAGGAASWYGVDQTNTFGNAVTDTGWVENGGTWNVSAIASSASGEVVVDVVTVYEDTLDSLNAGSGQTVRWSEYADFGLNEEIRCGGSSEAGASSVTMSWSGYADDAWASLVAVPIKPASSGGGQTCSDGEMTHAKLLFAGVNPTGTSVGTEEDPEIEIYVPTDRVGAFIRPGSTYSGTITASNVQLTVDYSSFGASADDPIRLNVFGIEMVFIPQGGFYIGDGDGADESTYAFHTGTGNSAVEITTALASDVRVDSNAYDESQIESTGIGIDGDDGLDVDDDGDIDDADNALFPTGYKSFYLMKYEMSQAQYRDFLNSLPQSSQNTRVAATLTDEAAGGEYVMASDGATTVTTRDTIKAGSNPADGEPYTFGCDLDNNDVFNTSLDGEWIALNYLNWMDLMAYADWAGLRPMTELEYEKAARGAGAATYGEYAWGSTDLTQAEGSIRNPGKYSETAATTGDGLANYNGSGTDIGGPLRVGFAATASTDRVSSGAGFYGNMNLSDNVGEYTVTVGNSMGRAFEGSHGDGTLTTTSSYEGNATNTDWPGIDATSARGVTSGWGCGRRGGSWNGSSVIELSDRNYATRNNYNTRQSNHAGRLARSADLLATVIYVTSDATDGDLADYGSDARDGADAFCEMSLPVDFLSSCQNVRALISVSSTDEVRDMPVRYGYRPELPVYWWNADDEEFNQAADNWDDLLDGSLDTDADTGSGTSSQDIWTGSSSAGAVDSSHYCSGWTSSSSGVSGVVGTSDASNSTWIDTTSDDTCDTSNYLYCVCQYEVP